VVTRTNAAGENLSAVAENFQHPAVHPVTPEKQNPEFQKAESRRPRYGVLGESIPECRGMAVKRESMVL